MKTNIADLYYKFIQRVIKNERIYSAIGSATDIDEVTRTCTFTPLDGGASREGIRLQSVLSLTEGVLVVPVNGSDVIVTFTNKFTGFVSLCSQVEKVLINTDLVQFNTDLVQFNTDLVQFNGGTLDGMVKINDLVERMNLIEDDINSLKTVFSTWITIPNDGGAALKAASTGWSSSLLTKTVKNNLENTKITQ